MNNRNYKLIGTINAKDREIYRLRKMLSENGLNWSLEYGHSVYVGKMEIEYWTLYHTPLGVKKKVTKNYPFIQNKRIAPGSINAYGWKVFMIIEVYKLCI